MTDAPAMNAQEWSSRAYALLTLVTAPGPGKEDMTPEAVDGYLTRLLDLAPPEVAMGGLVGLGYLIEKKVGQ